MGEADHALGKYRLIAEIGRGGMADVYLAVVQGPAGFNKLVVLKKTRRELAQDPDFLTMFLDEARLAARLNHPNVVQTTEVGQDGDRYFIAMEYLDGQPLNRVRSRVGAEFPLGMQVRVLADVLAGLHHAHELCDFDGTPLSVVHRDATPQNVFVTYDGLVKLVDFGIAKAIDSSSETVTGVVKGKVTYMAPEQARGDRVDRRADLFAVGVMLWEAVAGKRMWKGVPDLKVLHELLGGRVPSIREAAPSAPPELLMILDRALAPSPTDRYATAQEMHDALLGYLDATGSKGTSARDVGRFVSDRFAEDRAKVKAIIESQLRDVRWTGVYPRATSVNLPKIDPGQLVLTPTGGVAPSGSPSSSITPGSTSASHPRTPGGGTLRSRSTVPSEDVPTRAFTSEPPSEASGKSTSVTNATAALPLTPSPPAPKPMRPAALIGIAAIASALVIVLGVRVLAPASAGPANAGGASASVSTPPAASSTPSSSASGKPTSGLGSTVKVSIRATPSTAKVFLDDALLGAGTFDGRVVWSDQPKHIRIEAPHFVTREETVTFNEDVMLSFALEREPAGGPAVAPPPRGVRTTEYPPPSPPPKGETPATPAPTGAKPKRTIDPENPYAQ